MRSWGWLVGVVLLGAADADPIRDEFSAIADRIEASDNPYLGRRQIVDLEKRLAATDVEANPARVAALLGQLSYEHLRLGDVKSGARYMEVVFAMAAERGMQPTVLMHRLRAMVELRRAEVANCIARHNAECCLFPLRGGGVHRDAEPATRARESLMAILADEPKAFDAQWLLNLTSMAIGDYPEAVPKPFRIPPAVFKPKREVDRFVDIAPSLGLDVLNLCGGVVIEDLDGDGLLDIATSTSDPRGALLLYQQRKEGGFEPKSLASQLGGLNCIGGDYDGDGDIDLLVLRGAWMGDQGRIRNSLLRNDGEMKFVDVTHAAGLAEPAYPTQAAVWADFDLDGDLDLFVGNENASSQLFRNTGDGTFTDVAEAAGVTNGRMAKGVTAGDFDNDRDMDFYVSNIGANRLYRNDGRMRFVDVANELGVAGPEGRSFAPWFFDYDNDGWLDLFVAAYDATTANVMLDHLGKPHGATPPCLYRNREGTFENVAEAAGLNHAYLPMGANFGDIDNDGWLDIYLATGDPAFEALMPNVMLRNKGGASFENVTTAAGLGHLQKGHGIGFADFDSDGDQDIFHQLGGFYPGDVFHNALFENPGNENAWVSIELVGQVIGARVEVVLDGRSIHRGVGSVSSFGGSPIGRLHVGIGDAAGVRELRVTWPGDRQPEIFAAVKRGEVRKVVQGAGASRPRGEP